MLAALAARDGGSRAAHASTCRIGPTRFASRSRAAAPTSRSCRVAARWARRITLRGSSRELGTLDYHGIAMRPSSPAGVGRIG
jgi:hypothetical protein